MRVLISCLLFIFSAAAVYPQDNNPPVLDSFSFTPDSASQSDNIKVLFNLTAHDIDNIIEKIIVEFKPSGGGSSKSQTFSKLDLQSVALQGEIDFGNNPKTGFWYATIYLEDSEKNKTTITESDLTARGINPTFKIFENTAADSSPPELKNFSFNPAEIDLASADHSIDFTIEVTDDLSGVEEVTVEFLPPGNGGSKSETFRKVNLLTATLTGSIDFGNQPSTGIWKASITLKDVEGNQVTLSSEQIGTKFPSTFEIKETADNNPPELKGFAFNPQVIDLSSSDHSIDFTIEVTDDLSGVDEVTVEFLSPGNGGSKSETFRKVNLLTATLTGSIDFGNQPSTGIWKASIAIKDVAGNQLTLSSEEIADKFPSTLEVKETTDVTPPELINFSFSPSIIDLTSNDHSVTFSIEASDDLSGVEEVTVEFLPPGNGGSKSETFRKVNLLTATLTGSIDFGNNPAIGTWKASISVKDATGNESVFNPESLSSKSLPSSLEIIKTKDSTPPDLVEFTISPEVVELSSSNTSVNYKISVTDDLSGISEVSIIIIPNGSGGNTVEKITKINSLAAELYGKIDFKNSKEGKYYIEVQLEDNERNLKTYSSKDLTDAGFISEIILTNSKDSEPPKLVKFDYTVNPQNSNNDLFIINYEIKVTDNLSGIDEVKIMLDPSDKNGGKFIRFNNVGSSIFEYKGSYELKNPKPGEWTVSISITDKERNEIILSPADLLKAGINSTFLIAGAKQLVLVSPSSGENIEIPGNFDIVWESTGLEKINIDYSTDDGAAWKTLNSNLATLNRRQNWAPAFTRSLRVLLRISDSEDAGLSDTHSFNLVYKTTTSVSDEQEIPAGDFLFQNYPNPFNPSTQIVYTLKQESNVILSIYNMIGEKVAELVNAFQRPGKYSVDFDGNGLTSGFYFYQLKTSTFIQSRKMLLLK
ncbi:MAG TPA: T9SS type A sorting domain-containing protein [Melioribacteraceae bacterium]|nr:T9SS type A sorting domain-containing protein [Melioribacteraceae bacterium]